MEARLAADGGAAEAVAVVADACPHAAQQVALVRVGEVAEAQRVQAGQRPRAHREDVAEDAADPGRRAPVGLDVRGVVVALDLEDSGLPVANVDHAGVLARPVEHPGRLRRQRGEMPLARLVGAVLGPHHREDPELGIGRRALEQVEDALPLCNGEPVLARELERDVGVAHARQHRRKERSRGAPSVLPSRGSTACSGCGISPSTLPSSFATPAIASTEPLGLAPA